MRDTSFPMNKKSLSFARTLGLAVLLGLPMVGCMMADDSAFAGDGGDGGGDGPDSGVGQGGAQDFGLFREILLAGDIPGPDTIDDLGFFAEHKIDLPDAS